MRRMLGVSSLLVFLSSACQPSKPDEDTGDPGPPGSLRIVPEDAVVSTEPGSPAELDYRAFYTQDNGDEIEVTDEAMFLIDHAILGSFSGPRFTSTTDRGGRTMVRAMARGKSAATGLTVRLHTVVITPGTPADAPDRFDGAEDPARAPSLVYPPDGVLVPPNLNELEVHFLPGPGNTLFQLRFEGQATDLEIYMMCSALGAGCGWLPDEALWTLLAEAERGGDPVTVTLKGVDGSIPGPVGVSASQTISFGLEDILGGLYYWNAGAGAIRRYDFGRRGQAAENYLDRASAGASQCVGCHVLSRDGTRIAVGMDIPAPSPYKVFDVASKTMIYGQGSTFGGGANFFSFSPDGTQILTSDGASIVWRHSDSGAAIMEPLVASGAMPDWSADGAYVVYARPSTPPPCFGGFCGAPGVDSATLELLPFDGSTFGGPQTLVAFEGRNNYYPTFSPDAAWVMFNRSPGNMNSMDAPDAQVWAVGVGGGTPVHLATASTGGDSWPKWAPNVQTWQGRSLMWFTFSSRRAYGLRTAAGAQAQIWMAAFDPAKSEPSLPAFWLPFQEADSGNHIAQWVTEVERQPCFEDSDCPVGDACEGGLCVGGID